MPKCERCGAELSEDAVFCQNCGAKIEQTQPAPIVSTPAAPIASAPASVQAAPRVIDLAGWGDRIIAWIIDMLIIGVIVGVLQSIIVLPALIFYRGVPFSNYIPFLSTGPREVLYFIYFLFMDLSYGQSLGKMVMKIKVTNLNGGSIDLTQSAIESFGKAFLLPLDLIIGLIAFHDKSQRLFTYLAKTIVVKVKQY